MQAASVSRVVHYYDDETSKGPLTAFVTAVLPSPSVPSTRLQLTVFPPGGGSFDVIAEYGAETGDVADGRRWCWPPRL